MGTTYITHRKYRKGGEVYCYKIKVTEEVLEKCKEHSSNRG